MPPRKADGKTATPKSALSVSRRQAMGGAAAALAVWAALRSGAGASNSPSSDETAHRLMAKVCDVVLPETEDGPSASALAVHDFLALALKYGLEGSLDPAASGAPANNDYIGWLSAALDREIGAPFLEADETRQTAAVTEIDRIAFDDRLRPTPWIRLKSLILWGYYTSEVGASEVLRYEFAPGEFRGVVDLKPGSKAQSNDWTAVRFG